MPTRFVTTIAVLACIIVGCSARPTKPRGTAQPGTIFSHPADATQRAARDALVVLGFEVQKAEPLYLEGVRPRKVGVMVGSGGETAGVWLESVDAQRTRVTVDTAKSLVGIAGQRSWNSEILAEMDKALSKP